jgi:HD superfamily phosphodiesterase
MAKTRRVPKIKRRAVNKLSKMAYREEAIKRYMSMAFRQMAAEGKLTSAHNLGHVQRVSYYAGMYAGLMGAGANAVHQARVAGWSHDRVRDPSDSIAQKLKGERTHEALGAEYMKPMFERRYSSKESKAILEAMAKHGDMPALEKVGKNIARDAVIFADKFFEANGAYIAFRRSMFMGERKDWREEIAKRGIKPGDEKAISNLAVEATLKESTKRIAAFSDLSKIPGHMHELVKYQVQWQHRLVEGLEKRDPGVINLVTYMFKEGLKKNPRDLGELIKAYEPIGAADAEFKRESNAYLSGQLATTFRKLIKKPKK